MVFIFFISLDAKEWELESINFTIEDDMFYQTDEAYTYGAKLLALYSVDEKDIYIPFMDNVSSQNYISFAFGQKMYTPNDIETKELIEDDRPYAGYVYLESAIYQSYKNSLQTLVFQVGCVGESSRVDRIQIKIHDWTGSDQPQGWDNQLSDELVLQLNYNYKHNYKLDKLFGLDGVVIPEIGFDLGNASTRAYVGTLFRYGWGLPNNYGATAIDRSSYSQIPVDNTIKNKDEWIFCSNFGARANGIVQDIFLDGNTNVDSHSVEKNNFTAEAIYGLSFIYHKFSVDWIHIYSSKEFKLQKSPHKYTSFQISYHF